MIDTETRLETLRAGMRPERKGDWIQTHSGRQFWPLDPRPEEIFIEDIAHSLSLMCRYNGHCKWLYSVAQHSVYVSHQVPIEFAFHALLHDATEAYCCDLTRPVKKHLYEYQVVEARLAHAIAVKFGLAYEEPAEVKYADNSVLLAEKRHLMRQPPKPWEETGVVEAQIKIRYWPSWYAKRRFMQRFRALEPGARILAEMAGRV